MVRLLRRLATRDRLTGLSPARLSALSVLVFKGPLLLGQLAAAERVTAPTMSRIVGGLEKDGLVTRRDHPSDRRSIRISASRSGRVALLKGQQARVRFLAGLLGGLDPAEAETIERAAGVLLKLAESPDPD